MHHRTALRYFSFHFPNVFKQVSGAVKSERWQKIVFPSRHCCLNPHTGGSSAIWEKAGGGLGGKKAEKEGFGGAGGAGGGEQVLDAWHVAVCGEEDQGGGCRDQDGAGPHHGRLHQVGQSDPNLRGETHNFFCYKSWQFISVLRAFLTAWNSITVMIWSSQLSKMWNLSQRRTSLVKLCSCIFSSSVGARRKWGGLNKYIMNPDKVQQ